MTLPPGDINAADQFLTANRELLKIDNPGEELAVKKKWTDRLGSHHVRYQQRYQGLPVWGKEASVHMDGANRVYMFQGALEPSPQIAQNVFTIDERQAREAVYRHLGITSVLPDAVQRIEPVWYILPDGDAETAYCVEIQPDLTQRWLYFVDAQTGKVLHRISRINN